MWHFSHDYHNFSILWCYQYENNLDDSLYDNQWNSSDELGGEIAKQSDFYLLYEGEQLTGYAISLMPNDNAN